MKKTALTLLLLLGLCGAKAQTMEDLFLSMPDSLLPMLDNEAKKDLLDFYKSNMEPKLPNNWGTKSKLTKMETDFLQLEEDEHGTVTTSLAILPNKGKDLVVCMITTIKMPQPDSELFVYKVKRNIETDTDEWTPLDTKKIITLPSTTEKGESVPMVEYMEIKLIPQNNGYHSLEISTDNTDGQDDVKKPAVSIFKWNGTKFTLQK